MFDENPPTVPDPDSSLDRERLLEDLSRQFRGMTARETHGLAEAMCSLGWLAKLDR